jgi:hypothetical protein
VSELTIPNFGVLLGPAIRQVPERSRPAFLALLERGAADRYRHWASRVADAAEGLSACAEREDAIARRVDALFPAPEDDHAVIERAFPIARDAYYGVFEGLPLLDQLRIQANAERQGAAAWRSLAAGQPETSVREALEACAVLEETSADHLDALIANPTPDLDAV